MSTCPKCGLTGLPHPNVHRTANVTGAAMWVCPKIRHESEDQ